MTGQPTNESGDTFADGDADGTLTTTPANEEQEPLLLSEDVQEAPLQSNAVPTLAKRLTPLLGLLLAMFCSLFGVYLLYVLVHIPSIIVCLRDNQPELVAASLIDIADDSVLFSASLRFPHWNRAPLTVPFANVTLFHSGEAVGWMSANNLEVIGGSVDLAVYKVFHITNQRAMERMVRETVAQRRIAVDALTVVDMSGFGKLLPTVSARRAVSIDLPHTLPAVNYTTTEISGPAIDDAQGGVTTRATIRVKKPDLRLSANVNALRYDISFQNITIASANVGPVNGDTGDSATIQLPNTSGANFTLEIESLVPHMELLDNSNRVFATVDAPTVPFQMKQIAPMTFVASCDFEHLGLNVVSDRQKQFTRMMHRALVDRHLQLGVNSTVDVALATSIGKIRIDSLPFYTRIDHIFGPHSHDIHAVDSLTIPRHPASTSSVPEIAVSRMHISNTTRDLVSLEADFDISNPFSYGVHMSDLALHVSYADLRIAKVGFKELSISQGSSKVTILVDFYNHPDDLRQRMLFLDASSGKNMTVEVSGFPNCTSIAPLEVSLREFSQKFTVDMSRLKGGNRDGSKNDMFIPSFPRVLREVIFHLFSISVEATIVNPVSGAGIWLQAIEAVGYYKSVIPLGTLGYNFMVDPNRHGPASTNGLLLPFNQAVTTPRLPITANETSIGWDVLRRAIGGTLDVDVFTNIQVLVGNAQFNVTAMGKNAPVKIRL
ncbi:regulator of (H+)-ATPase in vacuolar membrane [Coemansia interrupta]|uniref:Regulator of (H+)-ATPase in vacuolar membrane n=1 Tax=Coemansia interrupta TaxID=1126814 RepID=A0A9W8LL88_9FUNG|nr:regulator of (H+)-ATPase in vacuolar membrane [Coemansia interrupta]